MRSAMLDHPAYVSGTHRDELALHRAIPGLVAKAGAEAVYAVGLPDGRGVAIKISDGSPRGPCRGHGRRPAAARLRPSDPDRAGRAPVLGHGERVGEIRPAHETLARLGLIAAPLPNRLRRRRKPPFVTSEPSLPAVDLNDFDAVLFDLDGVLTPTAEVHMRAWQRMFSDYLDRRGVDEPYAESDYFDYIDGKPRYDGVRSFLASRDLKLPEGEPDDPPDAEHGVRAGQPEERRVRRGAGDRGRGSRTPGRSPGSTSWPPRAPQVAVVSSSRNAPAVLAAAGLADRFEVVVDGAVAAAESPGRQAGPGHLPVTRPSSSTCRRSEPSWSRTRCPGSRPGTPATSGW